jgi:ComF family protein
VLAELLFPLRCPGCGRPAEPVCTECLATLTGPEPARPPPGVDAWAAPFAYEGVARELVARLKYRQARAALPWLATRMVDAVAALAGPFDAVTWVPTTVARRRARGFDQAALLARAVGRQLALPVRRTLVRAAGPPQTGRPASDRRAGPSFRLRVGHVPTRLLIVDDVATTGATITAAAHVLRDGGARHVAALTAARTPMSRRLRPATEGGARGS